MLKEIYGLVSSECSLNLSFPDNIVAYFSNFGGLGLVEIRRDILLVPEELYNELEAIYKPIFEKNPIEPDTKFLLFGRGRIDLTPFGGLFLQACLKKLNEA